MGTHDAEAAEESAWKGMHAASGAGRTTVARCTFGIVSVLFVKDSAPLSTEYLWRRFVVEAGTNTRQSSSYLSELDLGGDMSDGIKNNQTLPEHAWE